MYELGELDARKVQQIPQHPLWVVYYSTPPANLQARTVSPAISRLASHANTAASSRIAHQDDVCYANALQTAGKTFAKKYLQGA